MNPKQKKEDEIKVPETNSGDVPSREPLTPEIQERRSGIQGLVNPQLAEKSIEDKADDTMAMAHKAKQLAGLEITKYFRSQPDIAYRDMEKKIRDAIDGLPESRLIKARNALHKGDYQSAIDEFEAYRKETSAIINDYMKKQLPGKEELLKRFLEIKYYRTGKEFDDDAVKNPSLSDTACKKLDQLMKGFFRPDITEKNAWGILKLIEMHEQEEEFEPSPFMYTLTESMCSKLLQYYLKKGELADAYKDKSELHPDHVKFYSTLNTVLDDNAIDFFFVIDGAVFADGKARMIPVDITLKSHERKREDRLRHGHKTKYTAILSMAEIEKSVDFDFGEPAFLIAACNADRRDPLLSSGEKEILEHQLTLLAEDPDLNDEILYLSDLCADQIIGELENKADLESANSRLDISMEALELKAQRTGYYQRKRKAS